MARGTMLCMMLRYGLVLLLAHFDFWPIFYHWPTLVTGLNHRSVEITVLNSSFAAANECIPLLTTHIDCVI